MGFLGFNKNNFIDADHMPVGIRNQAQWEQDRLAENPNHRVNPYFKVVNGRVVPKGPGWLERNGADLAAVALSLGVGSAVAGPGAAASAGSGSAAAGGGSASGVASAGGGMGIPWGEIIKNGAQLFGNLYGNKQQISANDRAAQIQADAIRYGSDAATAANREAMDRAERESALDRQTAEANRRGNYDQWRAREGRIGTLGQLAGLDPRQIPDYVPLPGAGGGASGRPSGSLPPELVADIEAARQGLDPRTQNMPTVLERLKTKYPNAKIYKGDIDFGGDIGWVDVLEAAGAGGKSWMLQWDGPNGTTSAPAATPRHTGQPAVTAPRTLRDYAQLQMTPALQGQVFLPPSLRTLAGA